MTFSTNFNRVGATVNTILKEQTGQNIVKDAERLKALDNRYWHAPVEILHKTG